jgi:hypothetical protein
MNNLTFGYAMLAIQNALLGVVTPQLRAVIVDYMSDTPHLFIRFYYDGEVTRDLIELWECAITEASADLGPDTTLDDGIVRLDYPQKIPFQGRYAYLRKE